MDRNVRTEITRLLAAAALAAPLAAFAAAGEFTFVTGEVTLVKANGQRVTPAKGLAVDPGDRIATGANGMAQLTMVDQARLSIRPNTQFAIEQYPDRRDSGDGAVLSLLKGTLRTFTGLISATNRDKFVMKTRVATVGIRGSGNILYACDAAECDTSVTGDVKGEGSITVNHTIEGSHSVTNTLPGTAAQTVITGPGQTVLVLNNQVPRYIPTPKFISEVATNMTNAKPGDASGAVATGTARAFAPGDVVSLPPGQQNTTPLVGNNGLGFTTIDATANLSNDPLALRDIIIAANAAPFAGQALQNEVDVSGNDLRGYRGYVAAQSGISPAITGGASRDFNAIVLSNGNIVMGRYENADLGYFGPGSGSAIPGSVHWIAGPSGYPTYLADVLTGTASYTLAANTSPTNQVGATGTLGAASLFVNFTNRTVNLGLAVTVPGTAGGSWQMTANNIPLSLNRFYGSTSDRLVISNGTGQTSTNNQNLTGSVEGSLVGTGLSGAILGYGISDRTGASASWSFVSGVAGFRGSVQDGLALYREGRVSDPVGTLTDFIRTYSTTDRPDEVTSDTAGRITTFTAPYARLGSHATYAIGTAQVVQSGADAESGMIWGRWSGGVATVSANGSTEQIFLNNNSLHYIFAGVQSGPVALPLTGTAVYDVIGSTSPTDFNGHVGTLSSATLDANFTNRTANASVNVAINNQTWTGSATNMPIYREQYFSAYTGLPIPGVTNLTPLTITCTPTCGAGAAGSFDGFFTGRNGGRAGLMYNLGGIQGAVAYGRRGG